MWYEWLVLGLMLAGTCAIGWILYGGKCLADGQCILQKRGKKEKTTGIPR